MNNDFDAFLSGVDAPTKKPKRGNLAVDDFDSFLGLNGDEPASVAAIAPERTLKGTAGDLLNTGLNAAMSVPEAAVGLANMATGGYAGKAVQAAGVDFKAARKANDELFLSDAQKYANKKVSDAEGFVDTTVAALQNPSTIVKSSLESLPLTFAGGIIGRGVTALAPKAGSALAAAIGEGGVSAGSAAEQIRQQTKDGLLTAKQIALAAGSGALTAGVSRVSGAVGRKFGIDDIDEAIVRGGTNEIKKNGILGSTSAMVKSMVKEGAIEELPQSVQEQIAQNLALDKPWNEGIDQAGAMGMLAGAATAGGYHLVSKKNDQAPQADTPSRLLTQSSFSTSAGVDPVVQLQDRSRIVLALSQLDDKELEAATTHLAGGNTDLQQLLQQSARSPETLKLQDSVLSAGTEEYVKVADAIRRDAGITVDDTSTTATAPAAAAAAMNEMQTTAVDPAVAPPMDQSGHGMEPLNSAGFAPEPIAQIQAQLLAVSDGRKSGVVMGKEEAQHLNDAGALDGFSVAEATDDNGDTAVFVARSNEEVQAAVSRVNEVGLQQAAGEFLKYAEPRATSDLPEGASVIQQVDPDHGHIIDEQIVTPATAGNVVRIPGTTIRALSVEQAMAERNQTVAQEQEVLQQPDPNTAFNRQEPTDVTQADQTEQSQPQAQAPAAPVVAPLRQMATQPSTASPRMTQWVDAFNASRQLADDQQVDAGSIKEFTPLPKSHLSKIASSVKQAFGVDVVFVETPKSGMKRKDGTVFNKFNGFVDLGNNTLVMNVDAATPLNTLGHELAHLLQVNHPEIYAQLELAVLSRLSAKKAAEFKSFLSSAMISEGDQTALENEYRSELVAEAMGEMAQQEAFWADVFGRLDKEQGKTLYDMVMETLAKLANALTKNAFIPGVKDMQKVRRAATDAFIGWAAKEANLQDADNLEPHFPVTLADNDPLLTNTMEINTPERIALRKQIIDDHFSGKKPVADGSQTMIVLGGGGGVGKTTILKVQQKTGAFPADAEMVKINADDIKMLLPEYKQIVESGDWRAAMTTHAESSLLGKVIQYRALGLTAAEVPDEMKPYMQAQSGGTFNILLDATMSEPKKGLTLIKEAKARGYKVSMLAVVANAKTAIARAVKRGEGSGRFVPMEVLAGAHAGFMSSIGIYSNVVDEFSLYSNDVAHGESAFKLDIKNGNHQHTIHKFQNSAEEVRNRHAGDGKQSQGQGNPSVKPAELGAAPEGNESGGDRGGQADGLVRFSRENILAVVQGNRIAPMAVLDEPTKSMAQSGLDRRLPIRMEQSVVEKLLTGKDGLRRAMTPDEILGLKAQLENPVAVLDDPTDKNSVVLLTATLIDGEPLVIAISKTPIEKTYPIDNVSSLGRKTQGGTTEKAKFSPLKTAYSKDVGGILRWVQSTKVKHFDMALATKAYGKDLAPVTNALNIKSVTDKAYRVKEGMDGPLGRPAYDSGPTPPTLKQQGKEPSSSTEASVAQPKRIGANTLTLRKKLDSLTESRFSRDMTSDENQDEVGIADDSSIAPDVLHGRNGVVEKNRRWNSGDRKGQYIGAPDAYNTPGKIVKLRQIFRNLTKEGERGRFWYEESGKAVLKFVGGNPVEARKFVSLLAIYSPQAKVNANTTMALSAWVQYKSGQPINTKTELLDGNATKVLYENKQWGGEKTNNFYKNLMREVDLAVGHPSKQGATIDMWMMRAAGYESDAPTAAQYRFVENETNLLARELGWEPQQVQAAIWAAIKARTENKGVKQRTEAKSTKKGFMEMVEGAKGKPVRQINNAAKHRALWLKEAFGHEVTEDDTTQAIYHFGTALGERSAQLSWEATPGATTGVLPGIFSAPVSQQQEYLKAIQEALQDENGHDLIDKQIGLLVDDGTTGFSGWKGELSVGVQQQAPVYVKDRAVSQLSRNLIELSLAIRGLVLKQEGMAWHFPIYKGSAYGQNGAEVNLGRSLNSRETAVLYKAISDELGHTFAPPIPTKNGFRVLNFPDAKFGLMDDSISPEDKKRLVKELGDSNKAFHEAVRSAVNKQAWATEVIGSSKFESDGNLIENNWENGDGDYRRAISEKSGALGQSDQGSGAKRPDLLKWVDDELVPRINRVNERFAEKYGWGEPTRFSRTEDAQAVARLAEPAGRPSIGSNEGQRGSTVSQAIHYGKQGGLNTLVGAQFGKGIKGAEQARLSQPGTDPRIKRRVYFYLPVQGGIPASESGLGGNVYSADLTNLYDPDNSIKGIGATESEQASSFESAVLDAGYRGYMNREQGTAVVMNEDVPVRFLGTSDQFNRVQRLIQRIIPKVATRTEGSETVRKMDNVIALNAAKAATAAAPSFKMEYGEARVATTEKNAANEALEASGSAFQFSRMQDDMDQQVDFIQKHAEAAGYTDADEFIDKDYDGFVEAARAWRQEHPETTMFSRNATKMMTVQEALDFAKNAKLPFSLGEALRRLNFADAFMLAKNKDERSQLVKDISDATIKTFADSLIPVQRWIEGLPLPKLFKQRILGDMRRADTLRSAKEKEAKSKFAERMYLAIEKASGKYSTDQIKKLAGQWMTAKYAPKANRILVAKDRAKLKVAQAEMAAASRELALAQQARVAARIPGVSGAQVSVAALRLANAIKRDAEAPGKVADAMRELNERLVDVNGPVGMTGFTRGVAGGFNDASAAQIVNDIEAKIDPQLLADIAAPVYEMLAWKKQLDLDSGKVTQTMVNSWTNHADYVPLTGDPRFDEFSADIFQYGNQMNQDADKEMNGRKDSIADDGIDAAFTAVTKSINFSAFQDFKRSLNTAYESAQRQGSDIGLQRVPVTGIVRNGDDVVIYREATSRGMKAYAFKFDNKEVIEALKKGNHETVNAFINIVAAPTRLYGRLVTQFAPAFAPINFLRDMWERSEFVRVRKIYDQSGKLVNTDKAARYSIMHAINPQLWIASVQVNFESSRGSKLRAELEEFIALGGSSTWGSYLAKSSGSIEADIRSNTGSITRGGNKVVDKVSAWNNTFEMIAPLSIYMALKAQNVSPKDAAAATLDLMNFRKRGTAMPAIRALYVFAQPAATSGYNLAQYLATPKGKKRFAAQVIIGAALYALLSAAWGDDDDEELGNKLDNLPNYTIERTIPIKMGDMMLKVPVGFGPPQLAWAVAGILNRWNSGRYDATTAVLEAGKAWAKSSAPINPSDMEISKRPLEFLMTTLFPTVARPLLNIFADQTGLGSPLTPQFKDDKKMNYEQARRSTPKLFSDMAESIHEMTGIDLFPDHIKAISDGYMIGPMREIMSYFVDNPSKEMRGEKTRIPLVASLLDNINDRQLLNSVYYRERDAISGVAKEYESRMARGELGDWVTPEKTAQLMAYKQFKSQELMFGKMRNSIRKSGLDAEGMAPQLQALEERADIARRSVLVSFLQNQK